jgi:DNA-binding transcriptional MerR regulator
MSVNQGGMRIGEVHAQLRKLFPEVELSKIRYYEDKGLVQPSRSRKGYRLYSERDVDCLREAIRLAQEEFVPLRVVRLRLIEQGLLTVPNVTPGARHVAREATMSVVSAPAPVSRSASNPVAPTSDEVGPTPIKQYFSIAELIATTGLTPEEFNQIQALGLVTPVEVEGETMLSAFDVRVAAYARALLARGVDARLLGSLRRIAEREIGVIDELTQSLRSVDSERSRTQALAVVADVAREVTSLCNVLVERELSTYLRA